MPLPKVCEPENDIAIGVACGEFIQATLSATRPAQPVTPVSEACEIVVMNCCCWSLCENSCCGAFAVRLR